MTKKNLKLCEKEDLHIVNRRKFLKGLGATAIGAGLLCTTGGLLLTGCDSPQEEAQVKTNGGSSAPEWPYTYVKLDPEKVAERTFQAYKEGG